NAALNQAQIQSDMNTPVGSPGSLPLVSLSQLSLAFANQSTGTSSAPQAVTLTNVGGSPLSISSISVTSGNAGDFSETSNCSSFVGLNGNCTINVTFTPSTTGTRSSSLAIVDNAPGSPHVVSLNGTGTGFSVTPRVSVLTFTSTQQFNTSSGGV